MKKLYKFTTIILVSIILVTALLSNVVYGYTIDEFLNKGTINYSNVMTEEDRDKYGTSGDVSGSSLVNRVTNRVDKDGKNIIVDISSEHNRDSNLGSEQGSYIGVVVGAIIRSLSACIQELMCDAVGVEHGTPDMFTIQNLLMGKYELFDINIFNKDVESAHASDMSKKIKDAVAQWFNILNNIAKIASVPVLIYIAIRMIMSTTVNDRVKYKKMISNWGVGFALIFIMPYIIIILISLSDAIVKLLCSLAPTTEKPFEYLVNERIFYAESKGWNAFLQGILYAMLTWYQLKFFFIYLKRVISNAFLILISPLVTITYAIDKSNDMKAQAFSAWLQELITNIFIQPMHLLMFLVLLYSAGAIAQAYPIVAILFLFGLTKAEDILKSLFKLKGSTVQGVREFRMI